MMMKRTEAAISEVFEAAVDLGGTISGDHGVGLAKSPCLGRAVSVDLLANNLDWRSVLPALKHIQCFLYAEASAGADGSLT